MASISFASLSTVAAVGIGCCTVGYWIGMGHSLLSYNRRSKKRIQNDSDSDSDLESDDESNSALHQKASSSEECKMVLLVRTDLKMDKGKMAAQCGHATLASYKAALKTTPQFVRQWERLGQAKVALKCPDEPTMIELEKKAKKAGIAARSIIDAGRTQIAANTRTVLGIGPAPISLINQITGHLKLL